MKRKRTKVSDTARKYAFDIKCALLKGMMENRGTIGMLEEIVAVDAQYAGQSDNPEWCQSRLKEYIAEVLRQDPDALNR